MIRHVVRLQFDLLQRRKEKGKEGSMSTTNFFGWFRTLRCHERRISSDFWFEISELDFYLFQETSEIPHSSSREAC